jgi:tripartite-type tricarboxylate transporter receptor subunit TctC
VFVVHPSLPVKTVKDVIALAKARPGELTYASIGTGTPQHLAGEMFKQIAKIDLVHVPYQGGAPAVTAMLGGHVSMMFVNLAEVQPYIEVGRMRLIAVATAKRVETFKQVPTMTESGVPGFDSTSWFGMVAPAGTPKEIIAKLQADIAKTLQMPDIRANLVAQGLTPVGDTPEQFGTFIRTEMDTYAKVIKSGNIKAD